MYEEKKEKEMSESSWNFCEPQKKEKSTIVKSYHQIARISRTAGRTRIEQNRMNPSFIVLVFGQTNERFEKRT